MVSPLQRNAPEIIGLMGAALLLCQNSKYIPILKSKQWIQNSALRINNTLRINTHFSFLPAAMFSSGISLGVRKHICQIREQLTRAQADIAESARQVESLNRQLKSDLITLFPQEVLSKSCSYLSRSDIPAPARSCRKFNDSIQTPEVQSSLIEQFAFGPKDWKRFFGDVGEIPPIPEGMDKILKSQCPFNPGKQVGNTHTLVLIPQTVNSRFFTWNLLEELIKTPQGKNSINLYSDVPLEFQIAKSNWILMTKDVIPSSRNKTYYEQNQLVQEKGKGSYDFPVAIEAAVSILMHDFKTDERLYESRGNLLTYIRCQETVRTLRGSTELSIGNFNESFGLRCVCFHIVHDDFGVAAVRRF